MRAETSLYSTLLQWSDEDDCWIAVCPELEGVSAFGDTPEEAAHELETAKALHIQVREEDGVPLPEPEKVVCFSGQLRLRMPKSLHKMLALSAKQEGVSLNTYIVHLLSAKSSAKALLQQLVEQSALIEGQRGGRTNRTILTSYFDDANSFTATAKTVQ